MKITEDIYAVHPTAGCISYILNGDEGVTVVDTGSSAKGAEVIVRFVRERYGKEPVDIRRIILTHGHWDHAGGAAQLAVLTGASVIAHAADVGILMDSPGEERWFGHVAGGREALMKKTIFKIGYAGLGVRDTATVKPDQIMEGDTLPLDSEWTLLHLPGHTLGSIGMWSEKRHILFSGDTVLNVMRTLLPPYPMLIEDRDSLAASWRRIGALGHIDWVLPGHFSPLRIDRPLQPPHWYRAAQ